MTEPRTEAGRRLLDGIAALTPDGKRPYLDVDVEAVAAIEHEAVTAALPPHTRLILASEDLLEHFGTRTERGDRITAEWGEPRPEGWYEPMFTKHTDDNLVTAALERLRAVVEGLEYDLPEGITAWSEHRRRVLHAIAEEENR